MQTNPSILTRLINIQVELQENYKKCLYNVVYLQQEIIRNTPDERYEELTLIFNKIFFCSAVKSEKYSFIISEELNILEFVKTSFPLFFSTAFFSNKMLFVISFEKSL